MTTAAEGLSWAQPPAPADSSTCVPSHKGLRLRPPKSLALGGCPGRVTHLQFSANFHKLFCPPPPSPMGGDLPKSASGAMWA